MNNEDAPTSAAVSLKLPIFWTAQPLVWFAQVEAQFAIKNISADATKYYYIVSALDASTAGRLVDLLSNPPAANKYQTIKDRLTDTFALSRQERAKRILAMAAGTLGDRKPSEVMDSILNLLGADGMNMIAEQIFLDLMPDDIRPQLHSADFNQPRQVAKTADCLLLNRERSSGTSLIQKVAYIPGKKQASISPTDSSESTMCYYHARFGANAKKCRSPCSFSKND